MHFPAAPAPPRSQDNYENVYAVLSGEKTFTLLPPAEVYRLQFGRYAVARWEPISEDRHLEFIPRLAEPYEEISWSPVRTAERRGAVGPTTTAASAASAMGDGTPLESASDLTHSDHDLLDRKRRHPLFYDDKLPKAITVRVRKGEMLYLPSLWFHEVRQREVLDDPLGDRVLAVNFWWDMRFDARWAQYGLVRQLAVDAGLADPELHGDSDDET